MTLRENLETETTWEIREPVYDPAQAITTGSLFMTGNGYLGYRGTFPHDTAEQYVGCIVTDTWDNADGTWSELVNAPNGMWMTVVARPAGASQSTELRWDAPEGISGYVRELNHRYGVWRAAAHWQDAGISMEEERYAGRHDHHLLAARCRITADVPVTVTITTGILGTAWNLNGEHLPHVTVDTRGAGTSRRRDIPVLTAHGVTGEHRYDVVVAQTGRVVRQGSREEMVLPAAEEHPDDPRSASGTITVEIAAGETVEVQRYCGIWSTNDLRATDNVTPDARRGPGKPAEEVRRAAVATAAGALDHTWEQEFQRHCAAWDALWEDMDVSITGDDYAQTVLRYNIYHNIIATPLHGDWLPVGARGLSCQAYQGAAFWDQEVYNMPPFLYTRPEIARNILTYRYRTLDGARRKAQNLGYRGAFYAWVSGDTGDEICPSWFFKDVLTGRPIRNHFNDWQIHISPDIVWAVYRYMEATGDQDFLVRCGAEMVFEIARFLVSRVHYRVDRQCYEVIRVLGPDEYHENVDNNYFTNWQVRFACATAVRYHAALRETAREPLEELCRRITLDDQEVRQWEDIVARMYVPESHRETGVIEQFQGFLELEDIPPDELKKRLLDPGEYWGWPNGIAVATQVSKQADVLQLMVMHREAESMEVMRANWEYYEPRTQHGSSLSYAVYATSAAWLGKMEEAYRYFIRSCTVDINNTGKAVSGGTFIGGIHTAACGVAWQIAVLGFGGVHITAEGVRLNPHIPAGWRDLSWTLHWRGAVVRCSVQPAGDTAVNGSSSGCTAEVRHCSGDTTVPVAYRDGAYQPVPPGATGRFADNR